MSVINMMQDSCGCFRAEITAVLIEHCAEHDGKKQLLIQYGGVNYDVIALESERDALRKELAYANELLAASRKNQPLGPVIGAQTIIEQDNELTKLKAELSTARAEIGRYKNALDKSIKRICRFCGGPKNTNGICPSICDFDKPESYLDKESQNGTD